MLESVVITMTLFLLSLGYQKTKSWEFHWMGVHIVYLFHSSSAYPFVLFYSGHGIHGRCVARNLTTAIAQLRPEPLMKTCFYTTAVSLVALSPLPNCVSAWYVP